MHVSSFSANPGSLAMATGPAGGDSPFYEVFVEVFGDPVVCLPVSFMLLVMTAGAAAGMAKARQYAGSAVFGAFSAGSALLILANILHLTEVLVLSPEQKLFLFLLPLPFAVAAAVARRARRAQIEARTRAEAERRTAEENAAEQRRRAEEVRGRLEALGPRLAAIERSRGPAGAPEARALLAQAGQAYGSGNLGLAQELAGRAETGMREMENADRDRREQADSLAKQLDVVDSRLKTLIDRWLKYDPVAELGVDPLRLDRARLDAARRDEDARLQSAQAKQQQAGVLLGQGRIAESRDLGKAALSELERLLGFWSAWNDLKALSVRLASEVESAASWAAMDSRAYRRRLEDARLALAVQDTAAASAAMDALKAELDALARTHRPMLGISLPAREYRRDRFMDFQFTVRNAGKALARRIDITLEAPADFGPGGSPSVKLVSMAPGASQDCRLNLAFTREGSVPVLFKLAFEDNAGGRVDQEPARLTVNVLGR
jgi:hypothetical protein